MLLAFGPRRAEDINISGSLYRNKLKYVAWSWSLDYLVTAASWLDTRSWLTNLQPPWIL